MASFFFLTQIYIKHKNKFKSMNNKKKVRLFFKSLLMQLAEVETDRAKLIFDAPELKEGVEVFVESDGENEDYIPAPDGDYKTNDGKTIKVANGVVAEIIDDNAEVAPENPEEVKEEVAQEMAEETTVENPTNEGEETDTRAIVELRKEVNELYARIEKLENLVAELAKEEGAKPAEEEFKDMETKTNAMSKGEKMLSFLKK